MNDRLTSAFDDLRRLSEERRLDAAALLEAFRAQDELRPAWTAEQRKEIRAGMAEAERGEFASDEETSKLFSRFRK